MDPALFRIDFEVMLEVLLTLIVLAFFVERTLSIVFEHRWYVAHLSEKGLKTPIAFLLSLGVVWNWQFDAVGVLLHADMASGWGYFITAGIIAGGSKASIKLFHDIIKTKVPAKKK